ncbi:2-aminoethanethiol dioxygenase-like [Nilaparvata lugens]|uniref:2-aminoethanethiol dioxygenase-like n=1 Tax=Nilaparvata lugens TaxID=108931 RepID=UPI000B983B0A|nr:2-aminoethanethiol dioxygenase-like [Nilaparvata lugens]
MATLIEAVKRQALSTFSKNCSSVYFEENLSKLRLLASKLTSSDVELDKSLLLNSDLPNTNIKSSKSRLAPVTYIEVFENPDITIGIFILKSGARLPLHDHPLMYGILKVIHGKVRIHSYSPLSREDLTEEQASETSFVDRCGKQYSSHDADTSPTDLFRQVISQAVLQTIGRWLIKLSSMMIIL